MNSTSQRISATDEVEMPLVILFSGGYSYMEPDIKSISDNIFHKFRGSL